MDAAGELQHALEVGEHLPLLVLADEVAFPQWLLHLLDYQRQVRKVLAFSFHQFFERVVPFLRFARLFVPFFEAGPRPNHQAQRGRRACHLGFIVHLSIDL